MTNITRYHPLNEVVSLREAMNSLFEDSFIARFGSTERSASNLYETTDDFVLQLPLAGVKPEEVEITVQQNTVNVKWATQVAFRRTPPHTGADLQRVTLNRASRCPCPSIRTRPRRGTKMAS